MMHRYLIFGGTGSLGKKLIERLLPEAHVAVFSRDEAKHWSCRQEFIAGSSVTRRIQNDRLQFYVGDIRDPSRIRNVIRQYQPTLMIIAAALKQVDTCELSPSESVETNLIGTTNVINVINETNPKDLQAVLFVSTDKACSPVNVYGMCKAVSERIVTSQVRTGLPNVRYLAVRYGNVLESRGSIIPLFKYQAMHGDCLTVTDRTMTRFIMTLDQSVDLIKRTLAFGASGDTWIPRLPSMRIIDLAEIFAERFGKSISVIGARPGEKLHESLINETESVRTRTIVCAGEDDPLAPKFFVMKPSFDTTVYTHEQFNYSSLDDVLSKERLVELLDGFGVIDRPLDEFKGRSIEEIVTKVG